MKPPEAGTFHIPTLAQWCAEVDALPDNYWIVEDFVMADAVIELSGPPTLGNKTWLAFQLALVAASGKQVSLLKPTGQYPTLIIEVEGPEKPTRRRFSWLENTTQIPVADVPDCYMMHRQHFFLDRPGQIKAVAAFIKERGVKFVILDTLAKCMTGDENSAQDVGEALRGIDVLRSSGAAVMFVHHVGKPTGDGGARDIDHEVRGSSALAGFYDQHIALRRRTPAQTHLDCTIRSNEEAEKHFNITWTFDSEQQMAHLQMERIDATVAQATAVITPTAAKLALSKLFPETPYSVTALAAAWDLGGKDVHRMAQHLCADGSLRQAGKQYRVVGPPE